MVPGSMFRYGSSFWIVTRNPRDLSSRPSDADAIPFPSDDTTPPVTTMIFAIVPPSLRVCVLCPGSVPGAAPFQSRELLGGIDPRERPRAGDDLDVHASFERPQLLEPFRSLQLSRRPRSELQQQITPKSVDAHMAQRRPPVRAARDVRAAKVERAPEVVHHHLDHVLRGQRARLLFL